MMHMQDVAKEKRINAIRYFCKNTKDLTETKLYKLLYFLDFLHFKEVGRPVTVIATGFDRKKNMLSKNSFEAGLDQSLKLIKGNPEKQEHQQSKTTQTFSLDYERRRKRNYDNEDLEIPAFLRRNIE